MAGAEPGLKEARAEEGEEAWRLPVEDSPWAAQRLADRQRAAEALGARGQRLQAAAGSYAAALGALGAAQQAFAQALGGAAPHTPPLPPPRPAAAPARDRETGGVGVVHGRLRSPHGSFFPKGGGPALHGLRRPRVRMR